MNTPGWKSVTGSVGIMILAVVAFIIGLVQPDSQYGMGFEAALTMFLAGFYGLGLSHKVERVAKAAERRSP